MLGCRDQIPLGCSQVEELASHEGQAWSLSKSVLQFGGSPFLLAALQQQATELGSRSRMRRADFENTLE